MQFQVMDGIRSLGECSRSLGGFRGFFLSELEGGPLEVSGHIQTMIPGRPGSI